MPTRSLFFFSFSIRVYRASTFMRKSRTEEGKAWCRRREEKKRRENPVRLHVLARVVCSTYLHPPSTSLSEDLDVKGRDS